MKFVRDARIIEKALGDGVKRVLESELPIREKLRGVENSTTVSKPVTVVEEVPANGSGETLELIRE